MWHGHVEVDGIATFGAGAPKDAGRLGEDAWSIKAHSDIQARQQELVAHYTAARVPQLSEVRNSWQCPWGCYAEARQHGKYCPDIMKNAHLEDRKACQRC